MELIEKNLRPRDILTRKAFENAATVVAASGGSTNAGLHLPALAAECGIEFDLHDVAEIFKRTPYIADLKPGGRYVAKDMHAIGGVPVLMKALLDGGFCMETASPSPARPLLKIWLMWNSRQIRKWCIPPLVLCRRQAAWLACAEIWLRKVQL